MLRETADKETIDFIMLKERADKFSEIQRILNSRDWIRDSRDYDFMLFDDSFSVFMLFLCFFMLFYAVYAFA